MLVMKLFEVIHKKFPTKASTIDILLCQLPYELIYNPKQIIPNLFHIRDIRDYPVLYSAIIEDVDIFITGDADFIEVEIDRPEIVTPSEFLSKY